MKILMTSIALVSLFSQAALARDWDKIKIPGAVCGDGNQYSVFVDKKAKSENLLIEFMGGGACWSEDTCYGLNFRTWFHPIPKVPFFSYMTNDSWLWVTHPFRKDSAIYFPYCTGDVFSADHESVYDGKVSYHRGYRNIVMAMSYLNEKNLVSFKDIKRLTVWGASAGAIGAFVHLKNIEKYFPAETKKIAIIDSAGLHFGPTFWDKFTPELVADYQKTFASIGLMVSPDDGFIAPKMGPVFDNLKSWTVGVMQSTKDRVMSTVFGEIDPDAHKNLVLSEQGLPSVAKGYPNVHTWISDSNMHTFLLLKVTGYMDNMENQSAVKFVKGLVKIAEGKPITAEDEAPLTQEELSIARQR